MSKTLADLELERKVNQDREAKWEKPGMHTYLLFSLLTQGHSLVGKKTGSRIWQWALFFCRDGKDMTTDILEKEWVQWTWRRLQKGHCNPEGRGDDSSTRSVTEAGTRRKAWLPELSWRSHCRTSVARISGLGWGRKHIQKGRQKWHGKTMAY